MALLRAKKSEIPPDAVILNEDDALKYQTKLLKSWKHKSDTFAFRYGGAMLAGATTLTGIYFNNYYRTKLRLFNYGRLSSYLPIVVVPSILSFLIHTETITTKVVLQRSCVVCTEIKASAIQAFSGGFLPCVLAPLSAIPLAIQYTTYDIPYITKEPMKVFRLWQKMTKPIANTIMAIFLGQALFACLVTYFEYKSVHNVNSRLAQLEYELEHTEHPAAS